MPIYEYQCKLCGHEHEALQKMSDDPLSDCPSCYQPGLKKKISAVGFRLKGSGWYETDFKNSGSKPKDDSGSKSKDAPAKSAKHDNSCGSGGCSH